MIWIKFFRSTNSSKIYSNGEWKKEVQPSITLGRTGSKFPENLSQRDTLQISYGTHQRMESQQEVQTPGGEGNQDKGNQATIQAI
ncbi:hypothetical protein O181_025289 [Austropuccinia psidii MF-1]|uniref:Uncharacterized protein n=1 Tax=Austropuccinia psidii MF-1 TaxID=1389203 RepID=A0A9Q3H0H4_9BASI|nr:hypothetical protein [Austropuccinia psidii MF-1]